MSTIISFIGIVLGSILLDNTNDTTISHIAFFILVISTIRILIDLIQGMIDDSMERKLDDRNRN